jgi:hypothetical protein
LQQGNRELNREFFYVLIYFLNSHLLVKNELNALFTFFRKEWGEEGEWDDWEGGFRTKKRGPMFLLLKIKIKFG